MNQKLVLPLVLLAAPLAGQHRMDPKPPASPPAVVDPDLKQPAPAPVPATARSTREAPAPATATASETRAVPAGRINQTRLPADALVVDQPGDGRIWARTRTYKASFDGTAAAFVPFLGSDAAKNYPLTLTLRAVSVGGEELAFEQAASARMVGRQVRIDRGSVVERYDLDGTGVEQSFVFASLPRGGDLVVRIGAASELECSADGRAFRFGNELGGVRYGEAFVIDATGNRADVASRWDAGTIELRVPQGFLATATFPLTVDPVVTGFTSRATSLSEFGADIAYDASQNEYLVVWEEAFSASDHDIGSLRQSANGAVIAGSVAFIDQSTTWWAHPRVANLAEHDRFLVVAERGVAPGRQIWGRRRDAGTETLSTTFEISANGGSGDRSNPDVGGDANGGTVYWAVVWERTFSSTDSDVHAQLVDPTGNLNGGAILVDNTSGTRDINPAISKSDGDAPASSQEWNVVWQRNLAAGQDNIYFAQIHWSGALTTASTALDVSLGSDLNPAVSSPTDLIGGARYWLVVFQSEFNASHDIFGWLMRNGVPVRELNLSFLDNAFAARDQVTPHVDSDGSRFLVAWSEQIQPGGSDWDIRSSCYHIVYGTQLGITERRTILSGATTPERRPRVTSTRSADGAARRYGLVWDTLTGPNNMDVEGAIYDGMGDGGFNILSTGCSGLGMVTGGIPALGSVAQFQMTGVSINTPILMLSLPATPVTVCTGCQLAVSLGAASFFVGATLNLPIPNEGAFVGGTVAVQGFTYGTGPCLSAVTLSDTANCTIR